MYAVVPYKMAESDHVSGNMAGNSVVPEVLNSYKYQGMINANVGDEKKCWLNGVFRHDVTGDIYVMDRENSALKQFSKDGHILNSLELVDYLHSMILVNPSKQIVITKPEKRLTAIIDTSDGKLKVNRYVQNEKNYYGICQLKENVFVVSCWAQFCIDIINLDGHILKSIGSTSGSPTGSSINASGFPSPGSPDLLCVTSGGDIVASTVGNDMICIDQNGKTKWCLNNSAAVYGISSTGNGSIFATLKDKSKIIMLEEKSNDDKGFSVSELSFETPLAVYASKDCLLITTEAGCIHIYSVK